MFMRKDAGEPTTINPNEATIIPVSPGEWIIDPELEAKDGSGFVKTHPPTVTTSHSLQADTEPDDHLGENSTIQPSVNSANMGTKTDNNGDREEMNQVQDTNIPAHTTESF